MTRKLQIEYHENLKKILDDIGRGNVYSNFIRLRHRFYELIHIAETYEEIKSIYLHKVKEYEESMTIDGNKPIIFVINDFKEIESITDLVSNYYNKLKYCLDDILKILNALSAHLPREESSKPKQTKIDFEKFIKDLKDGEYSAYKSSIIKFLNENLELLCEIRLVRNRLKKDPVGELIYINTRGFLFKFSCNKNYDSVKTTKYMKITNLRADGSFDCTLDLDIRIPDSTSFFIEAFKAFVNNIAYEINNKISA